MTAAKVHIGKLKQQFPLIDSFVPNPMGADLGSFQISFCETVLFHKDSQESGSITPFPVNSTVGKSFNPLQPLQKPLPFTVCHQAFDLPSHILWD